MAFRFWLVGFMCLASLCGFTSVLGNDAQRAFHEGQERLAAGDLRAAYQAFETAVQQDRANNDYLQQFMLVRRALLLEDALRSEKNLERRLQYGQALRTFYTSRGLFKQALPIDEEIHRRLKTSNAAIQLAETHFALGQTSEAADILRDLGADQRTEATQTLLCVALVRLGQLDKAREQAERLVLHERPGPGTLYVRARMQAALGETNAAMNTLKACFESVPPSRLEPLKLHTRACADFASVAKLSQFKEVLQTKSKVSESQCSGGSNCSTCPMRASCAGCGR